MAQFEPGHRPRTTPSPAPPRGQPCHEPKPTAAFRVPAGRAQLRHPRAAAIGDLYPDSAGTGRHCDRDRLPGKTRAAVPNAVAEKLAREQDSVILAGMLRAEDRAHECADNPRPFHKPGNLQALANRRPSHQRTAFPSTRKARRGRTDAREIHAHLSRHRQAEYAPPAGWPQEGSLVYLSRVLPVNPGNRTGSEIPSRNARRTAHSLSAGK